MDDVDDHWEGYAAQVGEEYAAGRLTPAQLERDLDAALKLDGGCWEPELDVPRYLRDSSGRYLCDPFAELLEHVVVDETLPPPETVDVTAAGDGVVIHTLRIHGELVQIVEIEQRPE